MRARILDSDYELSLKQVRTAPHLPRRKLPGRTIAGALAMSRACLRELGRLLAEGLVEDPVGGRELAGLDEPASLRCAEFPVHGRVLPLDR